MGGCISSSSSDTPEARQNREVEKELRVTKQKMQTMVKVLLLGSGDSGKSTVLKQMRLIHKVPFSSQETEYYRQLCFQNIVQGMRLILDAQDTFGYTLSDDNEKYYELIDNAPDLHDGQAFPADYLAPLQSLWDDAAVRKTLERANEVALPENLHYFFGDLPHFFDPNFKLRDQDILRCRARTTGITETVFSLRGHDLHMLDVGGQKSERRKWIHCFQDVTTILFLASLSGYDQCLVEDKDANQMQDAMAIWDSICHSQWFKQTSIILFLNKTDLFEKKVKKSPIKNIFPDYDGEPGSVSQGKDYFRKRFTRLSAKSGRPREREIYVHYTNATDTALLRVVMAAVEDIALRHDLNDAVLI
jgi:guanine nucleotide-binding protein subunit alpha